MTTKIRTEVACLTARSGFDPYTIVVIVETENGFTSEHHLCEALMTAGDLALYRAESAQWAAEEAAMEAAGMFDMHGPEDSCFPTIELAIEHANILFAIHCVSADLQAYHAPSECYSLAFGNLEKRLRDIERLAITPTLH